MWMHASRPRWDLMKFTPQMQLKWENNGWRERYWSASRTEPWQDWAANTIHRHLQESTFTKTHTDSLSLSLPPCFLSLCESATRNYGFLFTKRSKRVNAAPADSIFTVRSGLSIKAASGPRSKLLRPVQPPCSIVFFILFLLTKPQF